MQETLNTLKVSVVSLSMDEINEPRGRIRNQAVQLFIQYGPRSVSMDDIAAALGISKKTIYQYYTDKDQLVTDAIELLLKENSSECESVTVAADNAIHEGFLAIRVTSDLFRNMNPLLMNDLKKYHPDAYKKLNDFKSEFIYRLIVGNIHRGIKEELYRDDVDINVLALYRMESIFIPFLPDFYTRVSSRLNDVQEELLYFFLHGMATVRGKKMIEKYKKLKSKNSSDAKN